MAELSLNDAYYVMKETPTAVAQRWTAQALQGKVPSKREASKRIAEAFNQDKRKAAVEAIGAISVYAYYEGFARRCLVEDMYPYGTQRAYSIFNKQIPAIMMIPGATSTPQMFAALNKIYPKIGTVRTEVQVPYIEMATLPQNPMPYLERQAVWGITKQEDTALLAAIEAQLSIYQDMTGTSANVYTTSNTSFSREMFTEAKSFMMGNQQEPRTLLMYSGDYGDLANMTLNQMGIIKEEEINGQFKLRTWMGLDVILSPIVPQGTAYMLPAKENMGYMPSIGGICAMNNPMYTSDLINDVVYAEFLGIVVENPFIVKLTKTVSNPFPNIVNPQPLGQIG